ncbi:MAG: hypothetical protein AUK47_23955 [Deltaproteobacteria bacterium CG2_30_63_29]|nr:MAG: hypothetical protein AUK47_23955 [Deltaproteobacteria bacterium CG2_30_63_29]PIV99918.1 MAG: transcriptional regulator [Deltaproteobacteria bacterium CG17_big_fil_post_rev_8_21_14_2_50_63_7]PJB35901.1 MAG: transcriptional regulator [Deltaproteobacteria bacterium CG_4_9_14_3_um_filter_63_12]
MTVSPHCLFVVSDSTGDTAEKVTRSALMQFGSASAEVKVFSRVRTTEQVARIVQEAELRSAVVIYTLVNPTLRSVIVGKLGEAKLRSVDLIGSLIETLSDFLHQEPAGKPGLLHQMGEAYFKRINAVEFTVKNDDGQEPRNFHKADIVLVGISRTSKTPVSSYLAQKGYKVANSPIVLDLDQPKELFEIDQSRVFALTVDAALLIRIRRNRLQQLGLPPDSEYAMREHVMEELRFARKLFSRNPTWPIIDVTTKAVEETANIIVSLYETRSASR